MHLKMPQKLAMRSLWPFFLLLWLSPSAAYSSAFSDRYDPEIQDAVHKWWTDLPPWRLWKAQLVAESGLNTTICSQVGACGLAQIMPGTWRDLSKALQFGQGTTPFDARQATEAGAYMMGKLRYQWRRDRQVLQSHALAAASYNRGIGNIIADQKECNGERLWPEISPCTLKHTREPVDYVERIWRYWQQMELGR